MKIKRLRHHVQNFGQMFCGWELMFDYEKLTALGSGNIKFDVLEGTGVFNDELEVSFSSVKGIKQWMMDDLQRSNIDIKDIKSATLKVEFETNEELGQSDSATVWSKPATHFIKCKIQCQSTLKVQDKVLTSNYTDFHEWPEGYSAK